MNFFDSLHVSPDLKADFLSNYSVWIFCSQTSGISTKVNHFEIIKGKLMEIRAGYDLFLEKHSSAEKKKKMKATHEMIEKRMER